MIAPLSSDTLAAAEVCFAVASRLLYVEPDISSVAEQVASRQFASAPFGEESDDARQGLRFLDGWCAAALRASEVPEGASTDSAAAFLGESPAFAEAVAELRREWLRLFVGLGTPEASCLESFYVEPNRHVFGKNVIAVREVYRRHGLEVERLHREPDDHLGLMLGFLSRLIAEEREALDAGEGQRAAALAGEGDAFLTEHVLPWLAPWRYAVERHARTGYYRGVGAFVFGLIACYAERFGICFDGEARAFRRRK
ncbi:molecular chaperone [Adlercreutzia muris]|jgi:TorA maturation chaperone TorD|uniref:TorD/DmsD family molecular chaperone n=1 Tax=Adlercreutzia muris TaxID=1796610 RepID=UPI001365638C|nr:molecular chaperone TorD family protein [Adlercreutzia muris]MCI8305331.1 molecular chaperone TorD family protein [Enterorhabdus sp.]NCA31175.1 molecular chaperone TorD [Adlercreutzia muris]